MRFSVQGSISNNDKRKTIFLVFALIIHFFHCMYVYFLFSHNFFTRFYYFIYFDDYYMCIYFYVCYFVNFLIWKSKYINKFVKLFSSGKIIVVDSNTFFVNVCINPAKSKTARLHSTTVVYDLTEHDKEHLFIPVLLRAY